MAFTDDVNIPIVATDLASKEFEKIRQSGERLVKSFAQFAKVPGFGALQKNAQAVSSVFKTLFNNSTQVNQALEIGRKVVQGVERSFAATAGQFVTYEQALVGVGKTTSLTDRELELFGDEMQRMSTQIPIAANELLNIAQTAGQLGVDGAGNLRLFTETVSKLGVATNLSAEEAATGFTRILNVTGQSITEIDRFASSVVALGNTFPATESEIVRMTNELARSTTQFGVTAQEAAALGTALRSVGIQAQLGGSVVGKAFRTIDAAVRQGGVELQKLSEIIGMSGEQIQQVYAEDSVAGFQLFVEGLGRLEKEGKSTSLALETLGLSGDEVNKVLPVLAKRSDLVAETLSLSNKAFKENAALNEEAAKAFATLGASMARLGNALVALGTDIGALLAPALKFVFDLITDGIQLVRTLTDDASQLSAGFKLLAVSITAAGAAWSVANFSQVVTFFQTLTPLVWGAVKAFGVFAAQVAVVGLKVAALAVAFAAVGTAVELVIRNITRLEDVAIVIFESMAAVVNLVRMQFLNLGGVIASVLQMVGANDAAVSLFDQLEEEQQALANDIQANFDEIERAGSNLDLGFSGEATKDLFNTLMESKDLFKVIGDEAEKSGNKAAIAFQAAQKDIVKLGKEFEKAVETAGNKAGDILGKMSDRTKEINAELAKAGADTRGKIEIEAASELTLVADFEKAKAEFDKVIAAQTKAGIKMTEAQKLQMKAFEESAKTVEGFKEAVEAQKEQRLGEQGLGADDPFAGGMVEAGASMAGSMASAVTSALEPVSAIMQAAMAVVGAVQQIIDFIPQFLDAIANIFVTLTELPIKITEAFMGLLSGIGKFISDFLPNLVDMVTDLLMGIVDFLATGLPDAFAKLAEKLPEAFIRLFQSIPEIIEKAALGLIRTFATMWIDFIHIFVSAAPQLVAEFFKMIPEMVIALVDGIILGLKEFFNAAANLFGLGDIFNIDTSEAEKQLEALGENVSRSAANLFEVVDLEASARGLDVADKIRDAINSSVTRAKNIFSQLWDLLVKAWRWVWDNIIAPIIGIVEKAWRWVMDNIINPLIGVVERAWQWVKSNIIDPLIGVVQQAWVWVKSNIIDPLVSVVQQAWVWVKNNIIDPLIGVVQQAWAWVKSNIIDPLVSVVRDAWMFVKNILDNMARMVREAFQFVKDIFDGLGGAVRSAFNWVKDNLIQPLANAFNALKSPFENLANAFNGIKSVLDKLANALNSFNPGGGGGGVFDGLFAEGGPVVQQFAEGGKVIPLYAQSGTFVPRGTDTVPAMLTPGEFVVNREATARNIGSLMRMNATNQTVANGDTNVNVVINTTSNLSADQIRREVVPTIKRELKRESLAGRFVIAQSGIRSQR